MTRALTSRIRFPHAANVSYNPRQVAKAYNAPLDSYDGSGITVGIVELGGGYNPQDMQQAGLSDRVTVVSVDGGRSQSDGPDGADGEVMLDVEVVAAVAPGAAIRVYFAPNTDQGFLDACAQACDECDYVSISWGGPESSWDPSTVQAFAQVFATARARGVTVFAASGDTGSRDGTSRDTADYPASDPSVVGCGGTRLTLNADGTRAAEVSWNDDPNMSASGGGISQFFPGRQVPDISGNADPVTGYNIYVDGDEYVIGGTSAVAPLYAACCAVLREAYLSSWDFVNTVQTNPTICFDVLVGNNGGYRAGPGRDQVTGFGVVDFGKMLAVLTSGTQVPAPGGGSPDPGPTPVPEPIPDPTPDPEPTPDPVPDPVPPPDPEPVPVPSPPGAPGCLNVLARILHHSQQISTEAEREIARQEDDGPGRGGGHGGGRGGGHGRGL